MAKDWAAYFYLVAEPPPHTDFRGAPPDLNAKAQATGDAIKDGVANSTTDLVAAVRTVWGAPITYNTADLYDGSAAASLSKTTGLLTPKVYHAPLVKGQLDANDMAKDIAAFYELAIPYCDATHIAVFFWGHSFGPGGLFNEGGKIVLPYQYKILKKKKPGGPAGTGVAHAGADDGAVATVSLATLRAALEAFPTRVDLVVFQDCWMSTLETAFALTDKVDCVIASEGQVPIGAIGTGVTPEPGVWDYKAIFDALDNPAQILAELAKFYAQGLPKPLPAAGAKIPNNMDPRTYVTYSALDLTDVAILKTSFSAVAKALLSDATLTGKVFPGAYLTDIGHTTDGGDDDMVDVGTLMRKIIASVPTDSDIAHVAQKVIDECDKNGKCKHVEVSTSSPSPAFSGIGILGVGSTAGSTGDAHYIRKRINNANRYATPQMPSDWRDLVFP